MKKTKEECLIANGVFAVDLGKYGQQVLKAMDDFAASEVTALEKASPGCCLSCTYWTPREECDILKRVTDEGFRCEFYTNKYERKNY
jgi:hypothetical protein